MKIQKRRGLILLVVLGMLSLFSLLAVTYVVFSSQARIASLAMAKRDYKITTPERLLDFSIKQVVRGTNDSGSALAGHDLLADLYGAAETPLTVSARSNSNDRLGRRPPPPFVPQYTVHTIPVGDNEGPQLYGGHLLKIPLQYNLNLPEQHDALTGRVLTFLGGPLVNQSVRIIRYVGEIDLTNLASFEAIQYSVIVDLSSIQEKFVTLGGATRTIAQWAAQESNGAALLYSGFTGTLTGPYPLLINAGELNHHGVGIDIGGTVTTTPTTVPGLIAPNNQLPAVYAAYPEAYLPNYAYLARSQGSFPTGDTDEKYDAADAQNFFLTLLKSIPSGGGSNVVNSDGINPAFHRPAIVNSIISSMPQLSDTTNMTPEFFVSTLEMLQRAVARPLAYRVKNFQLSVGPVYTLSSNPYFTGSTKMENISGQGARTPQLDLDWSIRTNATEQEKLNAWLRWLTRGPWDVDNDGDGISDSIWTDINLPLMTSNEGKLLKVLAAFYINDMDGKLDINASGSQAQADLASFEQRLSDIRFAYNSSYPLPGKWPQGLGIGTADISMAHLFGGTADYTNFLNRRYMGPGGFIPGGSGNDIASNLLVRGRPIGHSNQVMPGLPKAVHGRMGLGIDLLGNPIVVDSGLLNQNVNDPYDAAILANRQDNLYSFAEWERIVRFNDWDRSTMPRDMERSAGTSLSVVAGAAFFERARSISPRNVTLSVPGFAGTYQQTRLDHQTNPIGRTNVSRRVSSFLEFIELMAQTNLPSPPPPITYPYLSSDAIQQLFPIEFHQNRPLNVNRALGDGLDNDGDGQIDEAGELAGHGIDNNPSGTPPSPIDEPAEVLANPTIHQRASYAAGLENYLEDYTVGTTRFDNAHAVGAPPPLLTADEFFYYNGNQPKQLLARHLYCLAQLILPSNYLFPGRTAPLPPADRARVLAQWAVNVVDFRDADAVMTRFAYDATPFVVKTIGSTGSGYWNPVDGVVFGVEAQELIMTEALATHDLRIDQDPSPPPNTNSFQQLRVPEGSLFLEFFCPRSTNPTVASDNDLPAVPRPLYDVSGTQISLNLGLLTPATMINTVGNPVTVTRFPVWRVLLVKPNYTSTATPYSRYRQQTQRNSMSFQVGSVLADPNAIPANQNGLHWQHNTPPTAPNSDPEIDRILWFTNLAPTAANAALPGLTSPERKIYNRRSPDAPLVQGGQYMVVGPRPITYFGSKVNTTSGPPTNRPNNHRIHLKPNTGTRPSWVQMWWQNNDPGMWLDEAGAPPPSPRGGSDPLPDQARFIRRCMTMVAGADAPTGWPMNNPFNSADPPFIGLNISEPNPNGYYPVPTSVLNSNDTANPSDVPTGARGFNLLPPDAYTDLGTGSGTQPPPHDLDPTFGYLTANGWPAAPTATSAPADRRPAVATKDEWSTAILQRLADPNLPWNESLNPYLTVDMLPIDLTVFSGEMSIPPDTLTGGQPYKFATRQKTGASVLPTEDADQPSVNTPARMGKTFYSYHAETLPVASTPVGASPPTAYFDYELASEIRGTTPNGSSPFYPGSTRNTQIFSTLGYLNSRYFLRGTTGGAADYVDNNTNPTLRRYQGVPRVTPIAPYHPNRDFISNLELACVPISGPGTLMQEFVVEPPANTNVAAFGHTLDFDENGDPTNAAWLNRKKAAAILLQTINVESPWLDAWKIENPDVVRFDSTATVAAGLKNAMLSTYRAPYNFIPTFREPGRINLNTATEPLVFRGLVYNALTPSGTNTRGNEPLPAPFANNMNISTLENARRGYSLPSGSPGWLPNPNPNLDTRFVTEFAAPFGSPLSIDKVPNATSFPIRTNSSSEATLLRHVVDLPTGTRGPRLFAASSSAPHNVFLQNYPASRLANLVTDRSNVFSVRVVLGYFEFDPIQGIGTEYGAEQGRARRNRGFFVIDRSIPVAYQTGVDHNTDDCILVRRVIE